MSRAIHEVGWTLCQLTTGGYLSESVEVGVDISTGESCTTDASGFDSLEQVSVIGDVGSRSNEADETRLISTAEFRFHHLSFLSCFTRM